MESYKSPGILGFLTIRLVLLLSLLYLLTNLYTVYRFEFGRILFNMIFILKNCRLLNLFFCPLSDTREEPKC